MAFLRTLDEARMDSRYAAIIKIIYDDATFHVKIDDLESKKTNLGKGVRQGDTITPSHLSYLLGVRKYLQKLDWNKRGLKTDVVYLNHLGLADDIVLISLDIQELKSNQKGLKMNLDKTNILSNSLENIIIDNTNIEKVEKYIYLGYAVKNEKENRTLEIKRRIQLSWAAFGKLSFI